MGDTSTTTPEPIPVLPEGHSHINDELQSSLAALAHKHVTVSYWLIGVLVFVLALGGVGAFLGAKWVDAQLTRAEKAEELYKQDKAVSDKAIADFNEQLKTSEAARAAAEQKIADLQKQITTISSNASQKEQEVLKPGKTASEAYADLKSAYKTAISSPLNIAESPDKSEQELVLRVPDVQQMTATKIDDDAQKQIVTAKDGIITQKQSEIDGLKKDLGSSQDALAKLEVTEAQEHKALDDYKKVAKVTKFRKILNGAIKGVEIGAAILGGYELGHRF